MLERKPRLVIVLTVAVTALLIAAVVGRTAGASVFGAGGSQTISQLNVGAAGIPGFTTLDAARTGAVFVSGTSTLGLEGLMTVGPTGAPQLDLAQSMKQPNPFAYVFTLHKGIKFWDGNELTAEDVANAINYYRYPTSAVAFYYKSVRDVKAKGRYTVVIDMKKRDSSFLFTLTSPYAKIFEKAYADSHKGTLGMPTAGAPFIMGTGPWEFTNFDSTRGLDLTANPHWWRGKVNIQQISFKFFSDETSEALAFRAGEIDVGFNISGATAWAATAGSPPLSVPSCKLGFLSLPTKNPPWNDIHVRRAVAYAINRTDIINAIGGYAQPASTFIPAVQLRSLAPQSAVSALLKSINTYPYNLAKAKAEMAKSAYPNGFSASTGQVVSRLAPTEAIAGDLKQIGINLQVNTVPVGVLLGYLSGSSTTPPVYVVNACRSLDPSFYTNYFVPTGSTQNAALYDKPVVDTDVANGVTFSSPARRFSAYADILKNLANDVPYVPLFTQNVNFAVSSKLSWPTLDAFYLNRAWPLGIKAK